MSSVNLNNFRVFLAEQLKESVSEPSPNTKLYLAFGKSTEWPTENTPTPANDSIISVNSLWKTMIGGKKIFGNDIVHVIPRIDWSNNTVYQAYDHRTTDLYHPNNKFYVMTSDYRVYKCISNNYGAVSNTMPTSTSLGIGSTLVDGYVWKYMYTVSESERLRFTTSSHIPVKTLTADDNSQQWQVQQNAVDGAIYVIRVENGGLNYTNVSNLTITISGDGSGAQATPVLNTYTNTVNSVTMTAYGTGYTYATAQLIDIGSGTGAVLKPIISPKGGHGSDPLYELGGKNIMLNPQIQGSEDGILPITNGFRQIAILKDPYLYGTNTVFSNTAFRQTVDLALSAGSLDFEENETVYQGPTITDATFTGTVLEWDSTNNIIRLTNTTGTPSVDVLTGANSIASRFVSSNTYPQLKPYSGKVLYIDNTEVIYRNPDQIEDFKILVKF